MEMPETMPFVKTAIGDFRQVTTKTTEAPPEEVPVGHPNIAAGIAVGRVSDNDPDWKHAMRSAWQNFNRIYKCLSGREVQMNRSVARGRHIRKYFGGGDVIPAGVVHYIHVGGGAAIDRETHVATGFL